MLYGLTYGGQQTLVYDLGSPTAVLDVAITYDESAYGNIHTDGYHGDGAYHPRSASFNQYTFVGGNTYTISFTDISNLETKHIPAEWEETEGVWFVWELNTNFVANMVKEVAAICKAYIIHDSTYSESSITSNLNSIGVNMANVVYFTYNGSYNLNVWIRDFGPFYISEDGTRNILDFYHSYSTDDLPSLIGSWRSIPVIDANIIELHGGIYISDGNDTSFSSKALYLGASEGNNYQHNRDNFSTETEFLEAFASFTGNSNTVLVNYLDHEKTHHIDMWAKQINPTTFIVGQYSSGENVAILNNVTTQLQNLGYTVSRINQPPQTTSKVTPEILKYHRYGKLLEDTKSRDLKVTRSYTNSLIVNAGTNGKIVLVPSYSGYSNLNSEAQTLYQQLMPGYQIKMIDSSNIIQYGGAIHCTTMSEFSLQN